MFKFSPFASGLLQIVYVVISLMMIVKFFQDPKSGIASVLAVVLSLGAFYGGMIIGGLWFPDSIFGILLVPLGAFVGIKVFSFFSQFITEEEEEHVAEQEAYQEDKKDADLIDP